MKNDRIADRDLISAPKTILIVEDDPQFLKVARVKFLRKGHRVLSARNVSEAEEIWAMARGSIDLVVADNGLGHDLGLELLERFQKHQLKAQLVLCSGHPVEKEVPGISFVMKPFNVDEILECAE